MRPRKHLIFMTGFLLYQIKVSKYLPILLFVMAFVYATIFGFDYVILAFLIFLLIISITKNFAKK